MKNTFSGNTLMKTALSIAMLTILCAAVALVSTPVAQATGITMTAVALAPPGTGTEFTRATTPAPAQPTINLTATACTNMAVAQAPALNPTTNIGTASTVNTAYNGTVPAVNPNIVDDPKANITAEKYGYVMKNNNPAVGFTEALGKTPMAVVVGAVAKQSVYQGGVVLL